MSVDVSPDPARTPATGLRRLLAPEPARELPGERAIRIGLRTAHIASTGILLGGHFFDVEASRLLPWLWLVVGTGAAFVAVELYGSCVWLAQGRGLLTGIKLILLLLVPWLWAQRVWLLLAVLIIGSVGSHMSSGWRYFSVVHGRVFNHKRRG
jgi:hypothetical protein